MLAKIHGTLSKWPTWKAALVGLALVGVLVGAMQGFAWRASKLGVEPLNPEVRFAGYTAEDVREVFATWGPENVSLFAWMAVTLDSLVPLTYGALFSLLISQLFAHPQGRWLLLVPFTAVVCDFGENLSLAALAWWSDSLGWGLASVGSAFTVVKWIALAGCVVLPLIGAVLWMCRTLLGLVGRS